MEFRFVENKKEKGTPAIVTKLVDIPSIHPHRHKFGYAFWPYSSQATLTARIGSGRLKIFPTPLASLEPTNANRLCLSSRPLQIHEGSPYTFCNHILMRK